MSYVYIQQNGTLGASIPYPSPAHPSATVATSGCGVCASLMALMNLTTYKVSLKTGHRRCGVPAAATTRARIWKRSVPI